MFASLQTPHADVRHIGNRLAAGFVGVAEDRDIYHARTTGGRGVVQDDRESVRWFRLAAEQGDAEAQGGLL